MHTVSSPVTDKTPNVRLTSGELETMRQVFDQVLEAYPRSSVGLYGSRVDPKKKGGDIDLLIYIPGIAPAQALKTELELGARLKQALGDQRIDITLTPAIDGPTVSTFVKLIVPEAVILWP